MIISDSGIYKTPKEALKAVFGYAAFRHHIGYITAYLSYAGSGKGLK